MNIPTIYYRPLHRRILSLLASTLLVACLPLQAAEPLPKCERPTRLSFSVIPLGESQDNQSAYKPLIDELQSTLKMPVDLIIPPSYGSVIEGLLSGSIDLARMGPASYVTVHNSDHRIQAFAALVHHIDLFNTDNPAGYYSVLIARSHSAITSWKDLKGKKLSLVDPESTSGASIPRHYFARLLETTFDQYFSRIGYAGNHEQSIRAVSHGEVDAAFVSSNILSAQIMSGKIKRKDIRILWKSNIIPHAPFVYRSQLCADIKQKIQSVFFKKHNFNMTATLHNLHAHAFAPVTDNDYQILRGLP